MITFFVLKRFPVVPVFPGSNDDSDPASAVPKPIHPAHWRESAESAKYKMRKERGRTK